MYFLKIRDFHSHVCLPQTRRFSVPFFALHQNPITLIPKFRWLQQKPASEAEIEPSEWWRLYLTTSKRQLVLPSRFCFWKGKVNSGQFIYCRYRESMIILFFLRFVNHCNAKIHALQLIVCTNVPTYTQVHRMCMYTSIYINERAELVHCVSIMKSDLVSGFTT